MNILLVYPSYPETFWSFKHALKFISKKAAFPPLGLLTVAAFLPEEWSKKVVDMNADVLKDKDLDWADCVFISAMDIQRESTWEVIRRCKKTGTRIVAGGPLFVENHDEFDDIDHLVLGEAELLMPLLLEDLANGKARHIYQTDERPDITHSPVPVWDLVDVSKYATLTVQYSRGCPYDCEFCDIVLLNGHVPRTKTVDQLLNELEEIYRMGYRCSVFIVDDNFIGNKKKLKAEVLPALIKWMRARNYPFTFFTQASIGMADDDQLMCLMSQAGFTTIFVGIETPDEGSLGECGKSQNQSRDMIAAVRTMQNHGFQIHGGFIVGFDSDPANIFERQINFIQQSGIVAAMVGLLQAPRGTRLYKRLMNENRLVRSSSGDNTDFSLNFIPKMNMETLISGYRSILTHIYSPGHYYARITTLLKEYRPVSLRRGTRISPGDLKALWKSMWYLGIKEKGRRHYWRLMGSTLVRRPRLLPIAVALTIYGYHFRKLVERYTQGQPTTVPVNQNH